jgi:hypothetical protein
VVRRPRCAAWCCAALLGLSVGLGACTSWGMRPPDSSQVRPTVAGEYMATIVPTVQVAPDKTRLGFATPTSSSASSQTPARTNTSQLSSTPASSATVLPSASATVAPTTKASVVRFTIAPLEVKPGDPVTVSWEVTGTKGVLGHMEPWGALSPAQSLPSLSGNLVVNTSMDLREKETFVLAVTSTDSDPVYAYADVKLTCPDRWVFPNPPRTCPWPVIPSRVVIQPFERGVMLWVAADRSVYHTEAGEMRLTDPKAMIYVLANGQSWRLIPDNWSEGMAANDPAIVPPQGLFQPVRGFGLVWRTVAGVRDALGWARSAEAEIPDGFIQEEYRVTKYPVPRFVGGKDHVYYLDQGLVPAQWSLWRGPGQ